jgi:hypothetical protein
MTPVEQAAAVYRREWCASSFREDLEAHLLGGYVHSTPAAFVMARPVCSTAPDDLVLDPWHAFERAECDAWLVWLAAGDVAGLLPLLPYRLPRIGWQKRNRLRWHGFESALAKLARMAHPAGHGAEIPFSHPLGHVDRFPGPGRDHASRAEQLGRQRHPGTHRR